MIDEATLQLRRRRARFRRWQQAALCCSAATLVALLVQWQQVNGDLQLVQTVRKLLQIATTTTTNDALATTNNALAASGVSSEFPNVTTFTTTIVNANTNDENNETFSTLELANANATTTATINATDEQLVKLQLNKLMADRETNANQMLTRELDSLNGDFKSARSTLNSSAMLNFACLIGALLLALFVFDGDKSAVEYEHKQLSKATTISGQRIKNQMRHFSVLQKRVNKHQSVDDNSLRNILAIAIFGAVDFAACVGYVMLRAMVMSMRDSSSSNALLAESARFASLDARAEQLTAIAALKLIASRSKAANVDLIVCALLSLAASVRLVAAWFSIDYFRAKRRFVELTRLKRLQQQLASLANSRHTVVRAEQFNCAAKFMQSPTHHNQQAIDGFIWASRSVAASSSSQTTTSAPSVDSFACSQTKASFAVQQHRENFSDDDDDNDDEDLNQINNRSTIIINNNNSNNNDDDDDDVVDDDGRSLHVDRDNEIHETLAKQHLSEFVNERQRIVKAKKRRNKLTKVQLLRAIKSTNSNNNAIVAENAAFVQDAAAAAALTSSSKQRKRAAQRKQQLRKYYYEAN